MIYKCTVAYVGANYDGWQTQKSGRSVQECIESVIEKITHQKTVITASGRTDAGVSASGQVFMFANDKQMTPFKWMGALNAFLPNDIHIVSIEEAEDNFHARFCVRKKTYVYRIHQGMYDVFQKDTAYQIPYHLDVEKMKACANVFVGTHDFTSFNSSPLSQYPDQVRTVFSIDIEEKGDDIAITYTGKGFLRYMVRMMSAALIDAGRGSITKEDIRQMLEAKSKTVARKNAPAQGLRLEHVDYFEIAAVNEQIQIREFIASDPNILPYSLEELEEFVKTKAVPRYYVVCSKKEQQVFGYMQVNAKDAVIALYDRNQKEKIQMVQDQLDAFAKKNDIEHIQIAEASRDE